MMAAPTFADVAEHVREQVGYRLFTVLGWVPERRVLRRLWSSNAEAYAIGGEKAGEVDAAWLDARVADQQPFLGADLAAVRTAFHDHTLIESLGCGAVLNTTVVDDDGRSLAVLSVLDAEGAYDQGSLTRLVGLTSTLLPAVRQATTHQHWGV